MKRLILAIIIATLSLSSVSCATAMAGMPSPKSELSIFSVFNEKNFRNPYVDATIITGENTFMKMEITNDKKLADEVWRVFESDMRRKVSNVVEKWEKGVHKYIVNLVTSDGTSVSMSIEGDDSGVTTVWVSY